jgi:trehalose 6-phosphate phosphatase
MARPPVPERPVLFLDYDGTLAPIVENPVEAHPHPDAPDLVARLAERHPLWVISGRDLAALGRLMPVEVPAMGLHGSEEGTIGGDVRNVSIEEFGGAFDAMRQRVPEIDGVVVEDKSGAFAVHYRHAQDERAARLALEDWARDTPEGLEAVWGKKVVELRPAGVTKGTVVERLAARHPDCTPIYLGDDVTDEDAFRALESNHPDPVTVKVGSGDTTARYRLADVDEVMAYLRQFLDDGR